MSKNRRAIRDLLAFVLDVEGDFLTSLSLRVGVAERIVAVFVPVERLQEGGEGDIEGIGGDSGEKRETSPGIYMERCSLNLFKWADKWQMTIPEF